MPTFMRISISAVVCTLLVVAAPFGGARAAADSAGAVRGCVNMTVTTRDIQRYGDQPLQHYRIRFENRCETVRIVYWCAEYPDTSLTTQSPCARREVSNPAIAAPLYAVARQREFQWTFPVGTRIRYIDCSESTYPTSDLRCKPAATPR